MNLMPLIESRIDLRLAGRCLQAACLLAAVLIPFQIAGAVFRAGQLPPQEMAFDRNSGRENETAEDESYHDALHNSPFFGFQTAQAALPAIQSSILELVKDFHLKGVMLTGIPEAIVQDARTQKTIFVKAGDSLGELKVKTIEEGRMVLEYFGEEKTLYIE